MDLTNFKDSELLAMPSNQEGVTRAKKDKKTNVFKFKILNLRFELFT